MIYALTVLYLFVTAALIGVVLIQRSEGGGLGIGTSQGMGGFMSGRGTANLLTRTTAILGAVFFVLALTLALLNKGGASGGGRSVLQAQPAPAGAAAPATSDAAPGAAPTGATPGPAPAGAPPAQPRGPAVPTN